MNGRRYLVTVWDLAAGTLFDRLQTCLKAKQPGIPLDELLDRLEEAAEGLDYLHAKGFLHRDVTPKNIFVYGGDGKARLGDFGLARLAGLSGTKSFVGTPGFMALEVPSAAEARHAGRSRDLYSLAATFVCLRTGHNAFASEQAQLERSLDLTGIDAKDVAVLKAALSPEPRNRPNIPAVEWVRALRAGALPGSTPTIGVDPIAVGDSGRAANVAATMPDADALLEALENLQPQGLLDRLMRAMKLPPKHRPAPVKTHADRCLNFIEWCESVDGALVRLEAELRQLQRR